MNRTEFIKNIHNLKEIYVIHSLATRLPYVFCHEKTKDDYILVYTQEEPSMEKAKALIAEQKPAAVVKCREKEITSIFSSLKMLGINAIEFIGSEDGEDFLVQTDEFMRWPDASKLPEERRPVENPGLQLSLLYFLQEYRREADAPDRGNVRELSEEVYVNLTRSRFMLQAQPVENGTGNGKSALMLVKDKEGKAYLPLFTDIFEIRRFSKKNPPKQVVNADFIRIANTIEHSEIDGVVINPGSSNYPILKDKYLVIRETFAAE